MGRTTWRELSKVQLREKLEPPKMAYPNTGQEPSFYCPLEDEW